MKNSILFKVWALAGVILLASSGWGFETDKDSVIKGTLNVEGDTTLGKDGSDTVTVNGVIQKGACKNDYTEVGDILCVQTNKSSKAEMHVAIETCGDDQARVCTIQDMIYACTKNQSFIDDDMWLGNYVSKNKWAATMRNNSSCNEAGNYYFDENSYTEHNDVKTYRCCY